MANQKLLLLRGKQVPVDVPLVDLIIHLNEKLDLETLGCCSGHEGTEEWPYLEFSKKNEVILRRLIKFFWKHHKYKKDLTIHETQHTITVYFNFYQFTRRPLLLERKGDLGEYWKYMTELIKGFNPEFDDYDSIDDSCKDCGRIIKM
jgi:hypothetical protein